MNNNKNDFDEMQEQRRDKIGHQMFGVTFWAVLLYGVIFLNGVFYYDYGTQWLKYASITLLVIMCVCYIVYTIRLVVAGAYLPPKTKNRYNVIILVIWIVFSLGALGSPSTAVMLSVIGLFRILVTAISNRGYSKVDNDD